MGKSKPEDWYDPDIDCAISSFSSAIEPVKLKKRKKDKKRKDKKRGKT